MIRYKQFFIENSYDIESILLENFDSDEATQALDYVASIDDKINSINGEIKLKATNSKRITVTILLPADKRTKFVTEAKEILSDDKRFSIVSVASNRQLKDFAFMAEGLDKIIHAETKPVGKRSSSDPNELMTAAIACVKRLKVPTSVEEVDLTIEKAQEVVKKKVKDYKQSDLESFEKDYTNTCQAVSAALAIQKFMGGPADYAFMTGQTWNKSIEKFRSNAHGMKDFNSSDIVFRRGNNWYGISLKKKDLSTSADPTLINKAFSSLMQGKEFDDLKTKVDEKTAEFFVGVLEDAIKEGVIAEPKRKLDKNSWKPLIGRIDNKYINNKLKGRESLFKGLSDIIESYSDLIANKVIQLTLKLDLKDLKKYDFNFALVTGIGSYGPRKGVSIEPADIKDLDTIIEKMDELFSSGKPKIVPDQRKKQAYDKGATAAKLFYVLRVGSMDIMEIQIRYKGSFTSQPQYFAMMTDDFKDYLKK